MNMKKIGMKTNVPPLLRKAAIEKAKEQGISQSALLELALETFIENADLHKELETANKSINSFKKTTDHYYKEIGKLEKANEMLENDRKVALEKHADAKKELAELKSNIEKEIDRFAQERAELLDVIKRRKSELESAHKDVAQSRFELAEWKWNRGLFRRIFNMNPKSKA